MGILDWIKNKQEEKNKVKEEENELRRQVESEVSEEVIKIKKDKIKEEILSEARGEKKEDGKGIKLLKGLGDEFKQSNIGNSEQLEKLIGKQGQTKGKETSDGLRTDRLMEMIGSKKTANIDTIQGKGINTNKNFAELLGGSGVSDDKIKLMSGAKKK